MKKKIGVYLGILLVIGTFISPPFHGYLLFFFMNGLVLVNAVIIYHNLGTSSRYLDDILGISVIALSQITVTQLYPGLFGYLSLTQVVLTQMGCLGLTLIAVWIGWIRLPDWQSCLTRGQMVIQEAAGVCSSHAAGLVACVVACFAFVFVFAVSALNPPISIDSIFFHLVQAVYWLQTGYIPIKLETYFAYPHGNPLVYLWGLYPFHHDFIARFTQIPFILLGAFASYGICRILDMSRTLSLVTALAVLTMPAYLANGIALTDPDTQMAGAYLVSLYFALSLARSYRFSTIILLALALGQLLSAKYNSVYYGVPLVLLIIYAWALGLKEAGSARFVSFIGHGFLLFIIPISVGGVAYVYEFFLSQ
ncbi:MAG: glycosyltransferase family 39 protein, partial [Gemmatimonadota bacterium]|nr:glycosyltransferase family 39 protein [Gemmatimonadota bacterium]